MGRVLVVATGGAGGDLQPLVAAALALRARGHDVVFAGDASVDRALAPLGVEMHQLPPALSLGPRLIAAIREGMAATGGDVAAAGPIVQARLTEWARETAAPVVELVRELAPRLVVTSLFGVEVLHEAALRLPWAIVNSTFYVGPNPPRPIESDYGPRAVPLIRGYAALLEGATAVLHATDQVFDYSFGGLPTTHHYVGPLGIWEPPSEPPPYLDAPGDPWVLVSISSQMQDDIPLADAALRALGDRPVRVLVTVGPDHDPAELSTRPANARAERTVSHAAVLERGRLLVSHAGHGSVMKALWYGRPMVLVPWGRDQPGVAARAADLGVARVIDRSEATPGALAAAIDGVLADDGMRVTAMRHATRLQTSDAGAAAAAILEDLL